MSRDIKGEIMSNWLSVAAADDIEALDRGELLPPSFYWGFFGRRWPYIVVPFVLISAIGVVVAAVLPSTFLSEGKLIVHPQQVSTELVRATVTSAAQDRLQVIEQRTMSRDSLIEIADKYQLFPELPRTPPADPLVDLMKKAIKITVVDPPDFNPRGRPASPPVVFTVGFEYSNAVIAKQVANELIQRMVTEDVRDRTNRASGTTKFMAEDFRKLQAESLALDTQVSELRASLRRSATPTNDNSEGAQLAQLRQEYAQKSGLYSEQHPVLKSLRLQIQSLASGKSVTKSEDAESVAKLDALVAKQEATRKTLDQASGKLSAAQAGENLEKNRESEQLEVLEMPAIPQQALRPNRLKIALTAAILALGFGVMLAYLVNALDTGIRTMADIASVVDRQLLAGIPYIPNRADVRRRRGALVAATVAFLFVMAAASFSFKPLMPQFTELVAKTRTNLSQ